MRSVDFGPPATGAGSAATCGRGGDASGGAVGVAPAPGAVGAVARSGSAVGVDSDSGADSGLAEGVASGEASGADLPEASLSQSDGASSGTSGGRGKSGTRTGLADVAPVIPLLGAFQYTTSSTSAP
ncbi:hypothetical protein G6F22_018038 [Rhizopus arrhizus]|nr:hypothetical protein G6F22_018038 [Rhizopus arrhizus]